MSSVNGQNVVALVLEILQERSKYVNLRCATGPSWSTAKVVAHLDNDLLHVRPVQMDHDLAFLLHLLVLSADPVDNVDHLRELGRAVRVRGVVSW